MTKIGYHASHEQFAPSALLRYVQLAEQAGFDAAKSSDHFHPWSERQAQSGFAWSWLGAAMQATALPFGIISAPGYRYHPAVLAQAAATIAEMFPGRFGWLALGSGEHLNESITGMPWPDKAERNARLKECVDVTRALFAGETVTHRGRIEVVEAKLWSRPATPVPIYGAAVSEATARFVGSWADGLLTTGGKPEEVRKRIEAFRDGGGEGKPIVVQTALCWAPTEEEAVAEAMDQWTWSVVAGDAPGICAGRRISTPRRGSQARTICARCCRFRRASSGMRTILPGWSSWALRSCNCCRWGAIRKLSSRPSAAVSCRSCALVRLCPV